MSKLATIVSIKGISLTMKRSLNLFTLALASVALCVSQPVQAANLVKSFTSFLDAGQEVIDSTSLATGRATIDLFKHDDKYSLRYEVFVTSELDFSAIINETLPITDDDIEDVTKIHIHTGNRGENGPLPFPIKQLDASGNYFLLDQDLQFSISDRGTTFTGELDETEFAPTEPFPTFQSVIDILLSTPIGDAPFYWNIHTDQNPGGAIRGQFEVKTPEPSSLLGLLTLGLLGLGCLKKQQAKS